MEKTIEIPEGYEARIEGNKVILERKESEDKRIREVIESIIRVYGKEQGEWLAGYDMDTLVVHLRDAFAYLERQKEQKPAEDKDAIEPTPKQDYSGLTDFERAIHRGFLCAGVENVPVGIIKETALDCLAQIKPAEWSEEDERNINTLISVIKAHYNEYDLVRDDYPINARELGDWLKSLRPDTFQNGNSRWKPSEEQISALERAIVKMHTPNDIGTLAELRDVLKKL